MVQKLSEKGLPQPQHAASSWQHNLPEAACTCLVYHAATPPASPRVPRPSRPQSPNQRALIGMHQPGAPFSHPCEPTTS